MLIERQMGGAYGWWVDKVVAAVEELLSSDIKLEFRSYKQTTHLIGPVKEEYNFLQRQFDIMVSLPELRQQDLASVMQSYSMCKIKRVFDVVFSSSETVMRHEVEQGILQIVRNPSTPSLVPPNHRIFVKLIDGIKITHDTCDKSANKIISDHSEATKNATCLVCREDVNNREPSRLPCLHLFHHCCIMEWLQVRNECPACRSPVPHEFVTWF